MPRFSLESTGVATELVAGTASISTATPYYVTASVFFAETASFAHSASVAAIALQSISASLAQTATLAILATNAVDAVNAQTASTAISASTAVSANTAFTASFAVSSSYAEIAATASSFSTSVSASHAVVSDVAYLTDTASYSENAGTASVLLGTVGSASYSDYAATAGSSNTAVSSSHALVADTALNVPATASHATYAETAGSADTSVSSSHAIYAESSGASNTSVSSSHSLNADYSIAAGSSDTSVSSSHALVADTALNVPATASHATYAESAGTSVSASHAIYADSAGIPATVPTASHAIYSETAGSSDTSVSSSHAINADYALASGTSDTSVSSSHAIYADSAGIPTTVPTASHATYAETAGSSDTAVSSSHSIYSDTAGSSDTSISASHAIYADSSPTPTNVDSSSNATYSETSGTSATASYVEGSNVDGTVSQATNAVTSSYAETASFALNGGGGAVTYKYYTTDHTASNDDSGAVLSFAGDQSINFLYLPNTLDDDFNCRVYQSGSSNIQIVGLSADLVNVEDKFTTSGSGALATIVRVQNGDYLIYGDSLIRTGAPVAPTNLSASNNIVSASLFWTDNSNNELYFAFDKQINGGAWTSSVFTASANTTTTTDTDMILNVTQSYRMYAVGQYASSSVSNTASTIAAFLWDPLASDPVAYYNANSITGSDGTTINVWEDETGNGFNITKQGGAPTVETSGSLRYIDCDGLGDVMKATITGLYPPFTLCTVFRFKAIPGGNSHGVTFFNDGPTTAIYIGRISSNLFQYNIDFSPPLYTASVDTLNHVIFIRVVPGACSISVDSGSTYSLASPSVGVDYKNVAFASVYNYTELGPNELYETIVWSGSLDGTNTDYLFSYMKEKYGLW